MDVGRKSIEVREGLVDGREVDRWDIWLSVGGGWVN
jgi:hypothetical protein